MKACNIAKTAVWTTKQQIQKIVHFWRYTSYPYVIFNTRTVRTYVSKNLCVPRYCIRFRHQTYSRAPFAQASIAIGLNISSNQAQSEYKHSLTFCVRRYGVRRYDVIATKPVHRLQILPIMHNGGHHHHSSKLQPGPCGEGQTDRHADGRAQYTFRFGCASREM